GASVAGALDVSGVAALAGAAVVVAAGYALWNFGASRGSMGFLSAASYFAPVLSSIASSVLLGVTLDSVVWVGAALVVAGSLLSWRGSQRWSA
ncbi:MAG: EamA family transporter, partial [Eggerthellaceae bacterium]|nr:EamA family transporter [Eggerthellaceae bacterium]